MNRQIRTLYLFICATAAIRIWDDPKVKNMTILETAGPLRWGPLPTSKNTLLQNRHERWAKAIAEGILSENLPEELKVLNCTFDRTGVCMLSMPGEKYNQWRMYKHYCAGCHPYMAYLLQLPRDRVYVFSGDVSSYLRDIARKYLKVDWMWQDIDEAAWLDSSAVTYTYDWLNVWRQKLSDTGYVLEETTDAPPKMEKDETAVMYKPKDPKRPYDERQRLDYHVKQVELKLRLGDNCLLHRYRPECLE